MRGELQRLLADGPSLPSLGYGETSLVSASDAISVPMADGPSPSRQSHPALDINGDVGFSARPWPLRGGRWPCFRTSTMAFPPPVSSFSPLGVLQRTFPHLILLTREITRSGVECPSKDMIDCRHVHFVVVEPWPSNFIRLRFVASEDVPTQNPVPQRLSYVSSETGQMRRCVLSIACPISRLMGASCSL